jgi:hypothetical protein
MMRPGEAQATRLGPNQANAGRLGERGERGEREEWERPTRFRTTGLGFGSRGGDDVAYPGFIAITLPPPLGDRIHL